MIQPETKPNAAVESCPYGDYIVYVDESGDHSMRSINPVYPLFLLSFCIFRKTDYLSQVVPAVMNLKFKYFGHDMVILHGSEIRKRLAPFDALNTKAKYDAFQSDLTNLIDDADFKVITVIVDKRTYDGVNKNPYDVALKVGLKYVHRFLSNRQARENVTHIVFESRGAKEDRELGKEFARIQESRKLNETTESVVYINANKQVNSAGLQIADLTANPIGLSYLRPEQRNRAADVIKKKYDFNIQEQIPVNGVTVYF